MKKNTIRRFIETIVRAENQIASGLTVFLCLWIIVDVVGRVIFLSPLVGTPEITANCIVGILFLQVANVARNNQHIRSELLLSKLSEKGKLIVNIISNIIGIIFFTLGTIACWKPVINSWKLLEYDGEGSLHVPVYPFKTIVIIGCFLMLIQLAFNLKDTIQNYRRLKEV